MIDEELNPIYWPVMAWAHEVGDFTIRCMFQERPNSSFAVWVERNGIELEREEFAGVGPDAWEVPWQHTITLQQKYFPVFMRELRKRRRR